MVLNQTRDQFSFSFSYARCVWHALYFPKKATGSKSDQTIMLQINRSFRIPLVIDRHWSIIANKNKNNVHVHGDIQYICMPSIFTLVRPSPTVCQIRLASLSFGKNKKKISPIVWQRTCHFLTTWKKNYIERANIRARLQFGIVISLEEKPSERVKKKQRMIPEANI